MERASLEVKYCERSLASYDEFNGNRACAHQSFHSYLNHSRRDCQNQVQEIKLL